MRIDRCSFIVTSILIVTHQKAEAERNVASSDEAWIRRQPITCWWSEGRVPFSPTDV
jgi:hypothetical protein